MKLPDVRSSGRDQLVDSLSRHVADWCQENSRQRKSPLGITVGRSYERNLLFAGMTFDAVRSLKEAGQESVSVLELGVGSGINAVAGLLAGADYVHGIDIAPKCREMSRQLAQHYGVEDRLEVSLGNYFEYDPKRFHADVLVNENLSQAPLNQEPQVPVAQHYLPATRDLTKFVPLGLNYRFSMEGHIDPCYLGTLRFDRMQGSPSTLEDHFHLDEELVSGLNQGSAIGLIEGELINQEGEGQGMRDYPDMPLSQIFRVSPRKGENRIRMEFSADPMQYDRESRILFNETVFRNLSW